MTKNSILRKQAREQLGGNIFASNWLILLLISVIISALNIFMENITLIVFGIGGIIVAGPLQYGLARVTVNLARTKGKIKIGDLFKGFTEAFGKSFALGFMTELFISLWSLLFIIPGIVSAYSYAMAPFILQDNPSKRWKQCIDESRYLMHGHKAQLFWLDVSFIGWMIVGFFTCGVGMLFVIPYINQTRANFYLALKDQKKNEKSYFDADIDEDGYSYNSARIGDNYDDGKNAGIIRKSIRKSFKSPIFLLYNICLSIYSLSYLGLIILCIVYSVSHIESMLWGLLFAIPLVPLFIAAGISSLHGWKIYTSSTLLAYDVERMGLFGKCQKIVYIVLMVEYIIHAYVIYFGGYYLYALTFPFIIVLCVHYIMVGSKVARDFELLSDTFADGKKTPYRRTRNLILWTSFIITVLPFFAFLVVFGIAALEVLWVFLAFGGYYASCALFFTMVDKRIDKALKMQSNKE